MDRRLTGHLLTYGLIGGVVAGIIFILFEMTLAAVMGVGFLAPLVLISSIVLGTGALDPTFPMATAVITGGIVHLVLSAIFGVVFLYLVAWARQLCTSTGLMLLYGSLFGLALWVVNFLVLGSIFWPQFLTVNQFWFGFVAHTFFYGTVIGAYVASAWPSRRGIITEGVQPC